MKPLDQIQNDLAEVRAKIKALKAVEEPTQAQEKEYGALLDQGESLVKEQKVAVERRDRELAIEAATELDGTGGVPAVLPDGATITSGEQGPFRTLGEQLVAIAAAHTERGGVVDPRLFQVPGIEAATPSGAGAAVGTDGGFLIQKDFTTALLQKTHDVGQVASRCRRIPIGEGADGLEAPYIDETSRATGSRFGGVQVYWRDESGTVTAKRPKLGKFKADLMDLMGIAYATNRLLRDGAAIEAVFSTGFSEEFAFALDDAIIAGDGTGKPRGIKGHASLVSVAKKSGQAADTIVVENIINMFSSCFRPFRAAWFITQQAWQQLPLMVIGNQPIYMPPSAGGTAGAALAPLGTLMGLPIITIEHCEKLGDKGDIYLLNLDEYIVIEKGGLIADQSMHVRFLNDEMTFRWKLAVNGAPVWRTSLTPYKANTGFKVSPFVTLDARA